MGFSEEDYESIKATNFITNAIAYRQAGNSIVVNVLVAIFNYIYELERRKNQVS